MRGVLQVQEVLAPERLVQVELQPDVFDDLRRQRLLRIVPGPARRRVDQKEGHRVDDGHGGEREQQTPDEIGSHARAGITRGAAQ